MRTLLRWGIYLGFLAVLASTARADDLVGVEVVRVYDGDTIIVTVPGVPPVFGRHLRVRLRDLDAPELKGQCAEEIAAAQRARAALMALVRQGTHITLQRVQRDTYFRLDATLLIDGVDINALLLAQGLVRPYHGEKRQPWCPS